MESIGIFSGVNNIVSVPKYGLRFGEPLLYYMAGEYTYTGACMSTTDVK